MSMRHCWHSTTTVAVRVVKSCWIWKVVSGLYWLLDLGYKRKRRIKDNLEIIDLSPRKNGVVINGDGESGEELVLEKR